jgi:hypothetical protein
LLTAADKSSLAALNRRLWAWVEAEYHHEPHRGLNRETPLDRWAQVGDEVRWLESGLDLDDVCLLEARRKVHKDRTISLHGVVYEVEACLVDSSVRLRYDPQRLDAKKSIQVWSDEGKRMADAKVVDLYANCFVRRDRPSGTLTPDETPDEPGPSLSLSTLSRRDKEDNSCTANTSASRATSSTRTSSPTSSSSRRPPPSSRRASRTSSSCGGSVW